MESMLLPILIAVVAGLLVWGVICLIQGLTDGDKKKLAERLATEGQFNTGGAGNSFDARRSIVVAQLQNDGLPPALAQIKLLQALQRRVTAAYPEWTLVKFLTISAIVSVGIGGMALLLTASPIPGVIGLVVGGYAPFFLVTSKRNKRQKVLSLQIPEALDFLSRILRAGHSLTTGLQMMGEELAQPMATEFRKCYDAHSLGQPLEDSLRDMATRIESTDFAFFVTAVLIQRQTGGDLSEVLNNISGMIRQRIRLQQHVKAKTAEGRFTGYILVAFPAVMFCLAYVMNPGYAGQLLHTTLGMELLAGAFTLQMMGLFAIRKITTVKV
jgi:tight adherence protein B